MNEPAVRTLVENHERFLAFLAARVGSRDVAEEILQGAFVKAVEKGSELRDEESAVAWFYRLLRNAVVDHWRAKGAARKAKEAWEREFDEAYEVEARGEICRCIDDLIPTLKETDADLIRRVELGEERIVDVAPALGLTANAATVRLHRARKALKEKLEVSCGTCTEHGCLECTCRSGATGTPPHSH